MQRFTQSKKVILLLLFLQNSIKHLDVMNCEIFNNMDTFHKTILKKKSDIKNIIYQCIYL